MTTKLRIYNGALLLCGQTRLSALTDDIEARYLLDEVYDDGGINDCLEEGQWRFAMRSARFDYDAAVEPSWGLKRAFEKPPDWVVTSAVASDEYFTTPLIGRQYVDEADYWYADLDEIYVRYVSDDTNFGMNIGDWPVAFTEYVKAHFAFRVIHSLTKDKERWQLVGREVEKRRLNAQNRDAMAGPTQFPAKGSWVSSRRGGRGPLGDGGQSGSLTG